MKITILPATEFSTHLEEWDGLNINNDGVPVLSSIFVALLLKHFANDRVRLIVVRENGTAVLMALLESRRAGMLSTWQPGQAPLGLVVRDKRTPLAPLLHALFAQYRWTAMIDLLQLDTLFLDLSTLPPDAQATPYIDTPWIDCRTTFDAYWELLGKNLKRNMKKDMAKLDKQAIAQRLVTVRAASDVASAITLHGELESGGWKGEMDSAIRADNSQGRFYTDLLEAYCAQGAGLMFQYYYDDEIVASDFGIANKNIVVILKTAYRQSMRDTSPAQLLRRHYFPILFEDFPNGRIEFYGKALEWHSRWTSSTRPIVHVSCYRSRAARTFLNAVRAAFPTLGHSRVAADN